MPGLTFIPAWVRKVLHASEPGPSGHPAVNQGNAAEHFVAQQLQPDGVAPALLGLHHRLHAVADHFLVAVGRGKQRDEQHDRGNAPQT